MIFYALLLLCIVMTVVSLVKGDNRYENVLKALNLIKGNIDPAQISSKRILIKPNLVSVSNLLTATHVDAVRAVIDFVKKYKPDEIVVAEASAEGNTMDGFKNYGYDELEGVVLVDINDDQYETVKIKTLYDGEKDIRISKTVLDSDYIISVARAKTHDHLFCTLTIKNMMGSVPHIDHVWMHGGEEPHSPPDLANRSNYVLIQNLVRVVEKVKVDLAVVDGFVGMEGDGPVDGTPIELGVASAGTDVVAVDAVMTNVMGFDPWMKGDTYLANEKKVGTIDLDKITIVGDRIDEAKKKFKPHTNYDIMQKRWVEHHPSYSKK